MTDIEAKRWFYNPKQKEYCCVEVSAEESQGSITSLLVLLKGEGRSDEHYHPYFEEKFTALSGTLGVKIEGVKHLIEPGNELLIPKGRSHLFFNPGNENILYRVSIEPAHVGFENFIRGHFYLASRGEMFASQIPYNPLRAIVLYKWSGTRQNSLLFRLASMLSPFLYPLAKLLGVEKRLLTKAIARR